ncbi:Maf family nucleotide pyrophosphatase [Brumimicrobium aurantiacum]|uniref:dTTP/UTP pyrophosphatase n=1 Tax=Brumimicrobium aurantiacum TaxID=1737063 RepID=A0A3E1EYI8_9FLAO|nr:Maf family nucleotide pyrophosphatase [Brumimicrobium aurantiacum]RFC54608.1 septum formation protein Maf [Brumimicrobium aurantiacum]
MFSKKIILGSSSPRRKQLVEQLGVNCEIRKKEVEEIFPENMPHHEVPEYLSKLKAEPLKSSIIENEVLLTSDTVVILNGKILEKPANRAEAIEMLSQLSANINEVVTGVYLFSKKKEHSFSVSTKVYFKELSEEEIIYYVDRFKPFDKAGAYGIQEWIGMIGVEKIEGCFYNVMGLPMHDLWKTLNQNF